MTPMTSLRRWALGTGVVVGSAAGLYYAYTALHGRGELPAAVRVPLRRALLDRQRPETRLQSLQDFQQALEAHIITAGGHPNDDGSTDRAGPAMMVEMADTCHQLGYHDRALSLLAHAWSQSIPSHAQPTRISESVPWNLSQAPSIAFTLPPLPSTLAAASQQDGQADMTDDDSSRLDYSCRLASRLGERLQETHRWSEAEHCYQWILESLLAHLLKHRPTPAIGATATQGKMDGEGIHHAMLLTTLMDMAQVLKAQSKWSMARETLLQLLPMLAVEGLEAEQVCLRAQVASELADVDSRTGHLPQARHWTEMGMQWARHRPADPNCQQCLCSLMLNRAMLQQMEGQLHAAGQGFEEALQFALQHQLADCERHARQTLSKRPVPVAD